MNKPHLNLVFIGHVDAGKSTLSGNILYLTGQVDKRTIEKFEREAKKLNRESWFLAFIMDTSEEEREKGKTVDVGRAYFNTPSKRYTILDAPGHKNYVPNMISGATQADLGVLVISARKGEFESGFEKKGQTREHALLARTLGITKLIVVINKMDDKTVLWDKKRYDDILFKLKPFLRFFCGFKIKKDVTFIPISGLTGLNVNKRITKDTCDWYNGPSLIEALDNMPKEPRNINGPIRLPVLDKSSNNGLSIFGKVESGTLTKGQNVIIMPTNQETKITAIKMYNEEEVDKAEAGENIILELKGVNNNQIKKGFVISDIEKQIPVTKRVKVQLNILDLLDHKSLITKGFTAKFHIHNLTTDCRFDKLLNQINRKTGEVKKIVFGTSNSAITAILSFKNSICLEKYDDFNQLGRFTLRDEDKTIGIGKIIGYQLVTK